MNRTIGLWMLLGLAVASCWVVVGLWIGPSGYNLGRSNLVAITAPAVFLGRRMPLGAGSFVLLNGFVYAVAGMAIHLIRRAKSASAGGN